MKLCRLPPAAAKNALPPRRARQGCCALRRLLSLFLVALGSLAARSLAQRLCLSTRSAVRCTHGAQWQRRRGRRRATRCIRLVDPPQRARYPLLEQSAREVGARGSLRGRLSGGKLCSGRRARARRVGPPAAASGAVAFHDGLDDVLVHCRAMPGVRRRSLQSGERAEAGGVSRSFVLLDSDARGELAAFRQIRGGRNALGAGQALASASPASSLSLHRSCCSATTCFSSSSPRPARPSQVVSAPPALTDIVCCLVLASPAQ